MNTLQTSYQAVIDHITADIENLQRSGHAADTENLNALQTNRDWLMCRMNRLNERREQIINGFGKRLEGYLFLCDNFWKERHGRTYENRMDDLLAVKKEAAKIHSLTGFDACYALLLMLKRLRSVLPPRQYEEHAPALSALESIKQDCQQQMAAGINN